MEITVYFPGLRIATDLGFDPCEGLTLYGLAGLLGRASIVPGQVVSGDQWLAQAFGVQHGGMAKLTYQFDFGAPAEGEWLRADPVHLRADRDRVVLFDASVLDLQVEEAQSLVALLNTQFGEDGLQFVMATPERWYVRLPDDSAISTTPLDRVVGQDIHPHLPAGEQAIRWHRWLNEIQMLLYTAPVNDARELAGKRTANSVWVWGEGAQPGPASTMLNRVIADDPVARAYAALAGAEADGLASGMSTIQNPDRALVYLDALNVASRAADLHGWRDALQDADARWFAPLLAAWREGRIERLEIILPGIRDTRHAVLLKADRWKFWRSALPSKLLAV